MKNKYTKPITAVVLITGGQHLLTGSYEGVKATISGYEADDSDGFSQ